MDSTELSAQATSMLRLALAADGSMNRLKSLVQIANMTDVQLYRLQFDLDDV